MNATTARPGRAGRGRPAWPRFETRERRRTDHRTNLSSNELIHPVVGHLVGELIAGVRPADLMRYPVQEPAVHAAAGLFGREPECVLLAPGSDSVIRLLMGAARDLFGGRLILQDPNYEAWRTAAAVVGGWSVLNVRKPAGAADAWLPRLAEAAEQAAGPSIVAVSWPNGPDGHLPRWDHVHALLNTCREHGHLLVLDGCYAAFAGDYARLAALAGPHCLVLISWSKMFGLAGGRLAVALGAPDAIGCLRAFRQEDHVSAVMLAALEAGAKLLAEYRAVWADVAAGREELRGWLRRAGFESPPSGGNFLHIPLGRAGAAARLTAALSERGFRVRDMTGTPGLDGCVRFTVACGPVRTEFQRVLGPLLDDERREAAAAAGDGAP